MNQKINNNKNTIIKKPDRFNNLRSEELYNEISSPVRKQFTAWPCKNDKCKYQARAGRTKSGGYVAYP